MFKNNNKLHFVNALLTVFLAASCVKTPAVDQPVTPDATNGLGMTVSESFNYQTIATTSLDITLLTNDDKPLSGVMVNILDKASEEGGSILYTAISDASGKIKADVKLPTYLTTVIVDPGYIGLMHNAKVSISGSRVSCVLGGSQSYQGNIVPDAKLAPSTHDERAAALNYAYLGSFTSTGKPNYLVTPNDVLSAKTLSYINASLPEQKPVPTYHPDYLKDDVSTNLSIVEPCDVWITFVHEGAGYLNTLSYFTYPTNHPPTSPQQIDSLRIILPNASLSGSGGGLTSGNKVLLGRFAPGTTIGFCLITNGWNDNTKTIGSGLNKFYSIDAFNRETTAAARRHTVLLKDEEHRLVLAGFEDQLRDGTSDNDFNDIIFYASANPYTGIATNSIAPIDKPGDSDSDGVADVYDKYPTDPSRAYNNTYPKADQYASIAFEDNWPNTGDYDMNDLVVDYQYTSIQNAQNKTIELYANYVTRASGASFRNGFGVQFPFSPSTVASSTGSRVTGNSVVTLSANGTEAGQSKAVIIPFDDIYTMMRPSGANFINTQAGVPVVKPDTVKMKLNFSTALTAAQLGTAPFNQFIILGKTRGKEMHLPGELPTDKVNTLLFNTLQDHTIPSMSNYYKTRTNLPFAISIPEKFDYPYEGKVISSAYLKFVNWAQSGGVSNPDWYKATTVNRANSLIYK